MRAAKKKEASATKELEGVISDSDKEKKVAKEAEAKRLAAEFDAKFKNMQEEYEEVIGGLRKDLVVSNDKIKKGEQKMEAEKTLWQEREAKLVSTADELRGEKAILERDLEEQKDEVVALGKELIDAKNDLTDAQNAIMEMEDTLTSKEGALSEAEKLVAEKDEELAGSRSDRADSLAANLMLKARIQRAESPVEGGKVEGEDEEGEEGEGGEEKKEESNERRKSVIVDETKNVSADIDEMDERGRLKGEVRQSQGSELYAISEANRRICRDKMIFIALGNPLRSLISLLVALLLAFASFIAGRGIEEQPGKDKGRT